MEYWSYGKNEMNQYSSTPISQYFSIPFIFYLEVL